MGIGRIRYATSTGGIDIAYALAGPEDGRRVVLVPGFVSHLDCVEQFGPGPGEVLVSRTVRDLVVGSDLHFEDRGAHELRGVPDAWQLYAAVG